MTPAKYLNYKTANWPYQMAAADNSGMRRSPTEVWGVQQFGKLTMSLNQYSKNLQDKIIL